MVPYDSTNGLRETWQSEENYLGVGDTEDKE